MSEFFVVEKRTCERCEGTGNCLLDDLHGDFRVYCRTCEGTGIESREVPLAEALAALVVSARPNRGTRPDAACLPAEMGGERP